MLVRPTGNAGFEVFMLRRSQASHFVPDAYVFPGGTLDAADMSQQAFARARGIGDAEMNAQFRAAVPSGFAAVAARLSPEERAGLLLAAIRELFEEAGVLLACDAGGRERSGADLIPHRERLSAARTAILAGDLTLAQLLDELSWYADAGALALFSHWITPPVYPRRYNAHFFVARAGSDQIAAADAYETHDGIWIAPADALERCELGRLRMVYPTIKHLERLARFQTVERLMAFTRAKTIYSIMPEVLNEGDFSLPPDLEFAW